MELFYLFHEDKLSLEYSFLWSDCCWPPYCATRFTYKTRYLLLVLIYCLLLIVQFSRCARSLTLWFVCLGSFPFPLFFMWTRVQQGQVISILLCYFIRSLSVKFEQYQTLKGFSWLQQSLAYYFDWWYQLGF